MAGTFRLRRKSRLLAVAAVLSMMVVATLASSASGDHYLVMNGKQLHWERNGTAVAQVYMVDHTGPRWPVNASAGTWNQSSRLGVYYSNPGNCPTHCVGVKADWFGTDDYRGWAVVGWNAEGHLTGQTYVRFNNSYAANENKDRMVVCQELGHAIGLWHQGPDSTSCMTSAHDRFPRFPNDHDWNLLANLYDH